MNRTKTFITAFITIGTLFWSSISQAEASKFKDVEIGIRGYVAINYFAEHEIIKGYSDGTFQPDKEIIRAEALAFAEKAIIDFDEYKINSPVEEKTTDNEKREITKPEKKITLVEGVKMLLELEKERNPSLTFEEPKNREVIFTDVDSKAWFAKYIKKAKERNMIRFGFKNNANPEQLLTREYFADLTYRLIKSRDKNRMFGKATFYSDFFEGRGTSNGEKFTQKGFTAANKHLPFGTKVRITNLKNGQNVDVRINDRGPFNVSLDLDLTSTAFSQIASTREGIVPVQYEIISENPKP
ncbi:MAG: septal ring lytic transglycosylase RlpA family protein [Patescibacteria group bacterium]